MFSTEVEMVLFDQMRPRPSLRLGIDLNMMGPIIRVEHVYVYSTVKPRQGKLA